VKTGELNRQDAKIAKEEEEERNRKEGFRERLIL
jgi:hypothetical protein